MNNPLTEWIFSAKEGVKPPGFLRRNPDDGRRERPAKPNHRRNLRSAARTLILSITLPLLAGLATPGWADDIDIYFPYHGDDEAGAVRNPNILFMLDNSGSMAWAIDGSKNPPAGESRMDILKAALIKTLDEISGVNVGFGRFTKTSNSTSVVSNAPIIFPITPIDTPMDDLNVRNISATIAQSQDDAMEKVADGGGEVSLDDPTLLVVSSGGSELNRELTMTVGNSQYQVSFEGRDGDTWTYHVKEIGDKDLNHWILGVANACGDGLNSIVADTPTDAHLEGEEYTTTNADGDEITATAGDLSGGIGWHTDDSFSSGYFSFTLDQDYPEGAVNVHIKTEINADDVTSEDKIIGPNCASGDGGDGGGDDGGSPPDDNVSSTIIDNDEGNDGVYSGADEFKVKVSFVSAVDNANNGTTTWTYHLEELEGSSINRWQLNGRDDLLNGWLCKDLATGITKDGIVATTSGARGLGWATSLTDEEITGNASFTLPTQNYPAGYVNVWASTIISQTTQITLVKGNNPIIGPLCEDVASVSLTQGQSQTDYEISLTNVANGTWTYHVEINNNGSNLLNNWRLALPDSCFEQISLSDTNPEADDLISESNRIQWDVSNDFDSGNFSLTLDGDYPTGKISGAL